MRTEYGLEFMLLNEIPAEWSDYDRKIAERHLIKYGIIIVDAIYGTPIDNEYDLFVIYGTFKSRQAEKGGNQDGKMQNMQAGHENCSRMRSQYSFL